MVYETQRPEETYRLGEAMGQEACPGTVYCLEGDLGVGKTAFTQGFAKGLGVKSTRARPVQPRAR